MALTKIDDRGLKTPIDLLDNEKIRLGTGNDLQIFHDGSNSYLQNLTGHLYIHNDSASNGIVNLTNNFMVHNEANSEVMLNAANNGAVECYFNNTKRLETTNTGATVTGTLVADGLTVDTDTLHVDATNNRVGIGLTAPARNLHIHQPSAANAYLHLTNDSTGSASTDGFSLYVATDGQTYYRARESGGTHKFFTGGTEALTIDSSGNVGIGTTSPTGNLSIASGTYQSTTPLSTADDLVISGSQSLGISLITEAGNTCNNTIAFGDTDDTDIGMIRYAHADNSLQFTTNASERMRIDSSGRLLLGTTTPTNTLGVQAEIKLADNTVYDATSNRVHGLLINNDSDVDNGFAGLELRASDVQGYVGSVLLKAIADGTNYSNDFVIQTRHGGNYGERLRINSDGAATFAGAVTTGDLTILDGNPDLKLKDSNHGGNNTEHLIAFQDSSGNNQMNISSPFGEQHLRINHGSTQLVKIKTDGNVEVTGTVSDSKGNLRSIPKTTKSANHSIVAADAGTLIATNSQITVQGSQMSVGDAVTILNNSGSSIVINRNSISLYNTGNGNNEDTSLGARGIATIYFQDAANAYISGSSLGS